MSMTEPDCIDLRQMEPYRCWNEVEDRKAHGTDNPWDLVIRGSSGFVAPWGGEFLLACTRGRQATRKLLAVVPGAEVTQDGSDGQNFKFHKDHFPTVAAILRLRKRRRLTEAQRLAAAGRLARHAFSRGHPGTNSTDDAPSPAGGGVEGRKSSGLRG